MREEVIGFQALGGASHTRKFLAEKLTEIQGQFDLAQRMLCLVTDNAQSNYVLARELQGKGLGPKWNPDQYYLHQQKIFCVTIHHPALQQYFISHTLCALPSSSPLVACDMPSQLPHTCLCILRHALAHSISHTFLIPLSLTSLSTCSRVRLHSSHVSFSLRRIPPFNSSYYSSFILFHTW